ncbi:ExeM/NucH family extracellular endonuclease [Halomonas sp. THAF12]|uniref:ExeM/NucH family extracellular endonuclease n=1 Tax=Halomonas sp. B23F22_10 TaxID=3459515 RepID=UPI00373F832D
MSTEILLANLYRDILLREPDASGMAYWKGQLEGESQSLSEVAQAFLDSQEFHATVAPVIALYEQQLLRQPDLPGLRFWVGELREGLSLEEIGSAMHASEEADDDIASLSDEAWLEGAYANVFDRQPDPEGQSYWLQQLAAGGSRSDIVATLQASEEGIARQEQRHLTSILEDDGPPEQALDRYLEALEESAQPPADDSDDQNDDSPSPAEPPDEGDDTPDNTGGDEEEPSSTDNPDLGLNERYHLGASDASAAITVGDRLMLVADDEDQVLRLYDRDTSGEPLASIDLNDALGLSDGDEVDIEAVASLDGIQYWLGSHENEQRSLLFATRIDGSDADSLNVEVQGQYADLAVDLQAWDGESGHDKGANALGLAAGLNVEGAAFADNTLLLGLRAPLDEGLAQVIPVTNVPALVAGEADTAEFGTPLRLDLGGRVIRSIEPTSDGNFLVLAGPEHDDGEEGFALYHWDGAHAVREIDGIDLDTAPEALGAKPESIFGLQATDGDVTASVLYDSGSVDWLEDDQESKDLPVDQQRFISVDVDIPTLPDFTPRPGDIAITAVQADSPDDFQFVALKGISAGAQITFTDSGWNDGAFRANEGAVTWTAPEGGVAPGTLISFADQSEQFQEANGDEVGNNGFNLSSSGDQVIAFTGTPSEPTFLFAVQTNSDTWQGAASSSNDSALPPGLEAGLTAVAAGEGPSSEYDNVAYVGPGTGTAEQLLASIGNIANWTGSNDMLPDSATSSFRIGTMDAPHVPGERDIGLAITEIWSGQSGDDVTEDWFEITNRSDETLDVSTTPLYYDDESAAPEDAVEIQGLDPLAPGESAIVLVDGGADAVTEFRQAWSQLEGIENLSIGYAEDASGLGSGGDGVTLWLGDPRVDGDQVATGRYPDTEGFDAAAWDVNAQRFVTAQDDGVTASTALGGDNGDVPALATPGTATEPTADITRISSIQGSGDASPLAGERVTMEAIVTMVAPGLDGFFLQEEDADNDADATTSEGIFVYTGSGSADWLEANLAAGQQIRISGSVSEYYDKTQISAERASLDVLDSGLALPQSQHIAMPFTDKHGLEAFEGMRIAIEARDGEPLTVTELYELGRYGEVTLSSGGRLEQFTEVNAPDQEGYSRWLADAEARTIKIDDANSAQNPDPVIYGRNGQVLSADNPLRGGDQLNKLEGVLDFSFDEWKVQNVGGLDFAGPERPDAPAEEALGNPGLTVASFNVLNYFTTLDEDGNQTVTANGTSHDPRGADNLEEFARQEAKLVEAINTSGADVVGLMELENNGYGEDSAIASLVEALNADVATKGIEGVNWAYSIPRDAEGNLTSPGDDAIAVGMIYNSEAVTTVGSAVTKTDGAFATANRAPLLQTFEELDSGERFSAVVNHFKSKGSVINGEEAIGDGQGNNNPTRVEAAKALRDWLASDPTGSGDSDVLILGDLNAYAMEDPITTLTEAGYALLDEDHSYVYDGFWGSLDHALASASLASQVSGTRAWHINADEASALDYNTDYTSDRQDENLYAPDAFRSSDHDPVLVGLNLGEATSLA